MPRARRISTTLGVTEVADRLAHLGIRAVVRVARVRSDRLPLAHRLAEPLAVEQNLADQIVRVARTIAVGRRVDDGPKQTKPEIIVCGA